MKKLFHLENVCFLLLKSKNDVKKKNFQKPLTRNVNNER